MSFDIPTGLTELLQDFTVAVLRGRPPDLYQFAAEYFHEANERRSHPANFSKKGVSFGGGGGGSSENQQQDHAHLSSNSHVSDEDEESDEEFIGRCFPPVLSRWNCLCDHERKFQAALINILSVAICG